MSRRRCGGKLFHMRGPAAPKLRSPKLLCVRGTRHVLAAAERSWRRSLSVTSWMSSAMYAGVLVCVLVLYFLFRINSIKHRWDTRAQGTTFTSDVIWRHRPPPVTSRAHVTARTQLLMSTHRLHTCSTVTYPPPSSSSIEGGQTPHPGRNLLGHIPFFVEYAGQSGPGLRLVGRIGVGARLEDTSRTVRILFLKDVQLYVAHVDKNSIRCN